MIKNRFENCRWFASSFLSMITLTSLLFAACQASTAAPTVKVTVQPEAIESLEATYTMALVNGTLIDGSGAAPVPDAVVLINGEHITAAGPRSQVSVPAGAKVIDLRGATILPGFINAHVHNAYSAKNLETWAQAGITTVRDEGVLSSPLELDKLLKERKTEWSDPRHARLVSAGVMITAPGGYGNLYITTPEEAAQKVNEEIDQGADQIKISMENGYAGASGLPLLTVEQIQMIVTAAHARGRHVSAHITQSRYLQMVVEAGVDDAAHISYDYISDELIQAMIQKDIYIVPTLTVLDAYGSVTSSQQNLKKFVDAGGKIALGNDYTNIPQNNFPHFELGMPMHEINRMQEAGLTPMQIIVAATQNAAHVCDLENELGTLQPGKQADILIVNGNPLQDLGVLTQVKMVIHRGTIIRQ